MNPTESQLSRRDDRGQRIRQIAILLHTLPERTHRVLLGQLDSAEKQLITDEMSSLVDVDAMEQFRVLKQMRDELQEETSSVEKVESEIQDEIQIGRARVSKKRTTSIYRGGMSATDSSTDSPAVATLQPSGKSSRRDHAAPSMIPDGAQHALPMHTDFAAGQSVMPEPNELLQSMFAQFHQTQAAGVLPMTVLHHTTGHETGARHEDATSSQPGVLSMHDGQSTQQATNGGHSLRDVGCDAEELAQRIDQFLIELAPDELCRALGMVTTKQAFLVLCGLPNEIAEMVLQKLPRRQSRKVRSDMRRMGKLQLSDIDAAKQVVTEIAIRFTAQPRSFAA